jgi:hypothetical protein
MNDDGFYLKVAHALSGCQFVEQDLKLYITEALELVKKCIGDKMPFKMCGEDYADSSLERLIDVFRKLSDNDALVTELRKFKDERNFLSHKGITHCLDYEGDLCEMAAADFENRLELIQREAQRLCLVLHEEANKFRSYLWFDDLTKEK